MCISTDDVREKVLALEGWAEKLGALTQHSSQAVADLAKQLAKNLSFDQT